MMGFIAIAMPYIMVALLFSVLFWLVVKPRIAIIPVVSLLFGYKQISNVFAWHFSKSFSTETKADSSLRIVTWNVRNMLGVTNNAYKQKRNRDEIAKLVTSLHPDIICMQEFSNSTYPNYPLANNIGQFTKECPYYFLSRDYVNKDGRYASGVIIFSKYPIIDSGKTKYPGAPAESIIYADVVKAGDTIRMFTTHMQSFQFTAGDYANIARIKERDEDVLQATENVSAKMKVAFEKRTVQARIVRTETDKCKLPSIICGDFNDVPNSYVYQHIRGERQDAFLAASFGIGRSFNALAPTLRIDYILPDDNFNIQQFQMIDEGLSDHHLLVTDVSLKK